MISKDAKDLRNIMDRKIAKLYQEVLSVRLVSHPRKGKCKVTNLYVNPDTGKLEVEYEGIPV